MFFSTIVVTSFFFGVTTVMQVVPTVLPDARGLANSLTALLFGAQVAHLVFLFSRMGRGLDSALRKVIDVDATAPTNEAAKTTHEPLVSDAMRRNMLRYRRGSITIGIVSVVEMAANMLIPDHGGAGRAVAKYALSVLVPSGIIALSNQLLLKTIPARRDGRNTVTRVPSALRFSLALRPSRSSDPHAGTAARSSSTVSSAAVTKGDLLAGTSPAPGQPAGQQQIA